MSLSSLKSRARLSLQSQPRPQPQPRPRPPARHLTYPLHHATPRPPPVPPPHPPHPPPAVLLLHLHVLRAPHPGDQRPRAQHRPHPGPGAEPPRRPQRHLPRPAPEPACRGRRRPRPVRRGHGGRAAPDEAIRRRCGRGSGWADAGRGAGECGRQLFLRGGRSQGTEGVHARGVRFLALHLSICLSIYLIWLPKPGKHHRRMLTQSPQPEPPTS